MYKRIIGLILMNSGIVCRTRNFQSDYLYTDEFIDSKHFDEIVCIDVTQERSEQSQSLFLTGIEKIMEHSQLPLAIGGGIRSIEDIRRYRKLGADRYVINQTEAESDTFVTEAVKEFGKSSIVSSINHWGDFTYANGVISTKALRQRVSEISANRGSELLLNSVERDGTLLGFDNDNANKIAKSYDIPLIISGGVGRWSHVLDTLQIENIEAVCTSNIYHLTTKTISTWRSEVKSKGGNVRTV
jgi:cyclase